MVIYVARLFHVGYKGHLGSVVRDSSCVGSLTGALPHDGDLRVLLYACGTPGMKLPVIGRLLRSHMTNSKVTQLV